MLVIRSLCEVYIRLILRKEPEMAMEDEEIYFRFWESIFVCLQMGIERYSLGSKSCINM